MISSDKAFPLLVTSTESLSTVSHPGTLGGPGVCVLVPKYVGLQTHGDLPLPELIGKLREVTSPCLEKPTPGSLIFSPASSAELE